MFDFRLLSEEPPEPEPRERRRPAPGKRTLSQQLPRTRTESPDPAQPVQRIAAPTAAAAAAPTDDPFWFTRVAAEGVARASEPLPHLDVVQRAFGHHDLSGVRAQVGGDAAVASELIGATAYATGARIGFGEAPDLHTVAHEAAHVVQQRGGVQLAGGVGSEGDAYERHADEVADAVVRGESVVHLLDAGPSGGGSPPGGDGVQRQIGKLTRLSTENAILKFLASAGVEDTAGRNFLRLLIGDTTRRTEEEAMAALKEWRAQQPEEEDHDDGDTITGKIRAILGALLSSGQYVFSNPPLDSSGDIYHTVGFLAIMAQAGLPLPRVIIGYHPPANAESPTWRQATRAVEFATALGFGNQVSAIEVPEGASGQLNYKSMATRRAIAGQADDADQQRPVILDQKSSTALIALLMQKLGRETVTRMIRAEMTQYPATTAPEVQQQSDEWIAAQMEKIHAACPEDHRLVLFNERIADNQQQHNSEGPDFDAIQKQIAGMKKVSLYTLRSHGGDAPDGQEAVSSPSFAGAGADGDQTPAGFHAKVQHLQLLNRIRREFGDRLIGIYGSTSGTLDAAALIGIPTLSLHNFSDDIKQKSRSGLNDQDQRELLMAPFKSVVRRGQGNAADAFAMWAEGAYPGPEFGALGDIKPIYTRASVGRGHGAGFYDIDLELGIPGGLDGLEDAMQPMVGGIGEALAAVQFADGQARNLVRGASTGVGMNCLIHTMVQLADGAGPPGPVVQQIRDAMVDSGVAVVDGMLDPYEDGAGAALMQQFRQARGFRTQILQWTGGQLLVHPVVGGGGQVRLLLHAGNHFEPITGNAGIAVQPTVGVGDDDAAGGDFDGDLARAIAESLGGKAKPQSGSRSGSGSPAVVLYAPAIDEFSPVMMHDSSHGSLFVPSADAPRGVGEGDEVLIGGRRARVTAVEVRLIEVTYRFTWL